MIVEDSGSRGMLVELLAVFLALIILEAVLFLATLIYAHVYGVFSIALISLGALFLLSMLAEILVHDSMQKMLELRNIRYLSVINEALRYIPYMMVGSASLSIAILLLIMYLAIGASILLAASAAASLTALAIGIYSVYRSRHVALQLMESFMPSGRRGDTLTGTRPIYVRIGEAAGAVILAAMLLAGWGEPLSSVILEYAAVIAVAASTYIYISMGDSLRLGVDIVKVLVGQNPWLATLPEEKIDYIIEATADTKIELPLPILVTTHLVSGHRPRFLDELYRILVNEEKGPRFPLIVFTDSYGSALARGILEPGNIVEGDRGSAKPDAVIAIYTKPSAYPRPVAMYRHRKTGINIGVYECAINLSHFVSIIEEARRGDSPVIIIIDNINILNTLLDIPPSYINTYRFVKMLISRLKKYDIALLLYDPGIGNEALTNLLMLNTITTIAMKQLPVFLKRLIEQIDFIYRYRVARPEVAKGLTQHNIS